MNRIAHCFALLLLSLSSFAKSCNASVEVKPPITAVAPKLLDVHGIPSGAHPIGSELVISATTSADGSGGGLTLHVEFGDLSSSSVPSDESTNHVYRAPGVYTISVFVTSDGSGASSTKLEYSVPVYDPSAGFVTGSGWFDSPEGALIDSNFAGIANFGYNAGYKKGDEIPTGEFNFQAGDFHFESTSLDWLVLSGRSISTFEGNGKVNGSGQYKFLCALQESDEPGAEVDNILVRITNLDTNELVYDNTIDGEAEDSIRGIAIGGGSVPLPVEENQRPEKRERGNSLRGSLETKTG